jgi:hypothetical protein
VADSQKLSADELDALCPLKQRHFPFPHPPEYPQHQSHPTTNVPHANGSRYPRSSTPKAPHDSQGSFSQCFSASYPIGGRWGTYRNQSLPGNEVF